METRQLSENDENGQIPQVKKSNSKFDAIPKSDKLYVKSKGRFVGSSDSTNIKCEKMQDQVAELVESSSSQSLSESDNGIQKPMMVDQKPQDQFFVKGSYHIKKNSSKNQITAESEQNNKKDGYQSQFMNIKQSVADIQNSEESMGSDISDEVTSPQLELLVDQVENISPTKISEGLDTFDDQPTDKGPPDPNGWRALAQLDSLPLMKSGYSLEADMKFGWKPTVKGKVLPIPFVFDTEDHLFNLEHFADARGKVPLPTIYQGFRPRDSFKLYKMLLNNIHQYHGSSFPFKVPSELPPAVQKLLDQQMQNQVLGKTKNENDLPKRFTGMNTEYKDSYQSGKILQFDSSFESGNLDRVVMVSPNEYDLYMRPDTNTKGHHQWFYFRVISRANLGPVKFNIINFTKTSSLHEQGMKICICSAHDKKNQIDQATLNQKGSKKANFDDMGWKRGGYDIIYERSKLNEIINFHTRPEKGEGSDEEEVITRPPKTYFQLSFKYDFDLIDGDETYFAYSFPYTFTRLIKFIKEIKSDKEIQSHLKDASPICHSLSGVDIPFLIVTSRANQDDFNQIIPSEHSKSSLPPDKTKRTMILTGRVHPGESNASFMMEGFIKFITSPTNETAVELRKRIVFKIIPCINPDGVMAGNYRVSMSGNDLNRRYLNPHSKLHPIVCAVKKLIKEERPDLRDKGENPVLAFIDMHGHSRKKNVFMYGPEFPIHDTNYIKMRVIPKLMSLQNDMFRFYSCKFRIQKSKEKTARVVLWRQYDIANCYTLEASFYGFYDHQRETRDFDQQNYYKVGKMLIEAIFEFVIMREDEGRQIQERLKQKKLMQIEKEKNEYQIKINKETSKKSENKEKGARKKVGRSDSSTRQVLSPDASSEAILPTEGNSDEGSKIKINNVKKKATIGTKEGKKKQFKVTKKFKDDLPPRPHKKQTVNPNEPEEDKAESESNINPTDSSINLNEKDFVASFRMKQRTFSDLCNQIQDEDNDVETEEGGTSDGRDGPSKNNTKLQRQNSLESDSEDDALLMKIHNNIIGLLNADQKSTPSEKLQQKIQQSKEIQPKKAQKKQQAVRLQSAQKMNKPQNVKGEEKKITKFAQAKKLTNPELPPTTNLAQEKSKTSKNKVIARNDSSTHNYRRELKAKAAENEKKQVYQNITPSVYPAQTIQMNMNNFNDRIMNEQVYSKHKTQYSHGTNAATFHLNSLSSGAQKLLSKQLQQDQIRRMQVIEAQNQAAMQKEKEKSFTYYNFQARRDQPKQDSELDKYNQQNISQLGQEDGFKFEQNEIQTDFSRQNSKGKQLIQFNPPRRHGGSNSKASSDESLNRLKDQITFQQPRIQLHQNVKRSSQPQIPNSGYTITHHMEHQSQNFDQAFSHPRNFETEDLTQSSNMRNRKLIPASQKQSTFFSLENPIKTQVSHKMNGLQSAGGSFKTREKNLKMKQQNIVMSVKTKVQEANIEESPQVASGSVTPCISPTIKIRMKTAEKESISSSNAFNRTSIQNKQYQEELMAKRNLIIQDDRFTSTQPVVMTPDQNIAQIKSVELKKSQIDFAQPEYAKQEKNVMQSHDQTTIEIPIFFKPQTNNFQFPAQTQTGQRQQKTIYMTKNDTISMSTNKKQDQQHQHILERGRFTNPGSRLDVNSVISKGSPNTSIKAKARNMNYQNKKTDYQSFSQQNQGLQTIKSQLLAQSELNKQQNRQKSMKKPQKSDMIRMSITSPKVQSLLKPDDQIYVDKSAQIIMKQQQQQQQQQQQLNQVQQQHRQIVQMHRSPDEKQKMITNTKTVHIPATSHGIGGSLEVSHYQNQQIYKQKVIDRLKFGTTQHNYLTGQQSLQNNEYDKQRIQERQNQIKLQQNVYNDLQELQRELNHAEQPIRNIRNYSNSFQINSNQPQIHQNDDSYSHVEKTQNKFQTQKKQSNKKINYQQMEQNILQQNLISHNDLVVKGHSNQGTEEHQMDSLLKKLKREPSKKRSSQRNNHVIQAGTQNQTDSNLKKQSDYSNLRQKSPANTDYQ